MDQLKSLQSFMQLMLLWTLWLAEIGVKILVYIRNLSKWIARVMSI